MATTRHTLVSRRVASQLASRRNSCLRTQHSESASAPAERRVGYTQSRRALARPCSLPAGRSQQREGEHEESPALPPPLSNPANNAGRADTISPGRGLRLRPHDLAATDLDLTDESGLFRWQARPRSLRFSAPVRPPRRAHLAIQPLPAVSKCECQSLRLLPQRRLGEARRAAAAGEAGGRGSLYGALAYFVVSPQRRPSDLEITICLLWKEDRPL